jgi:hypothetical protein
MRKQITLIVGKRSNKLLNFVLYSHRVDKSAKLFLQSSELGLPNPLTRRRVCAPPPFGFFFGGGAHSLAGEEGTQFGREDTHCGTINIYVLCVSSFLGIAVGTKNVPVPTKQREKEGGTK